MSLRVNKPWDWTFLHSLRAYAYSCTHTQLVGLCSSTFCDACPGFSKARCCWARLKEPLSLSHSVSPLLSQHSVWLSLSLFCSVSSPDSSSLPLHVTNECLCFRSVWWDNLPSWRFVLRFFTIGSSEQRQLLAFYQTRRTSLQTGTFMETFLVWKRKSCPPPTHILAHYSPSAQRTRMHKTASLYNTQVHTKVNPVALNKCKICFVSGEDHSI